MRKRECENHFPMNIMCYQSYPLEDEHNFYTHQSCVSSDANLERSINPFQKVRDHDI